MKNLSFASLLLLSACSADINGSPLPDAPSPVAVLFSDAAPPNAEDASSPDAPTGDAGESFSLTIVSPTEGTRYVREEIEIESWVARVSVELNVSGLASVTLLVDGELRGESIRVEPWLANLVIYSDGAKTLEAVGYDNEGIEVARDSVTFSVDPPSDTSCHAMLDALGLDWRPTSATRGIPDPVRVEPTIRGVAYRYVSSESPSAMVMDCGLAPRLARLADIVSEYGIDEIVHIGVYNYRCIGGGTPDSGCTPSQHAYARAIDLHEFGLADNSDTYNVETDWNITGRGVCPGTPTGTADQVLHEIACRMHSESVFNIILTPEYNAAHRNHFHVDLTSGSNFVGVGVSGVDPLIPNLGH